MKKLIWLFIAVLGLTTCHNSQSSLNEKQKLPVLGHGDHRIPDFSFINQDSQVVTNDTFINKAYVVDFFFINCPTICPKLTKSMLRLHDKFIEEDRLLLLAHSIDPKRDTVGRLAHYARNLGVTSQKWHFVTGDKDAIYEIADYYFSIAVEDMEAEGGFNHSGRLILVDKDRRVRAFCDGTDSVSVSRFINDIELLLDEM